MQAVSPVPAIAAKWWVEKTKQHMQSIREKLMSEEIFSNKTTLSSSELLALENAPSVKLLEKFEKIFSEKIDEEIKYGYEIAIYADADNRCSVLWNLSKQFGISMQSYPQEVVMWVSKNFVKIKNTTNKSVEQIYP